MDLKYGYQKDKNFWNLFLQVYFKAKASNTWFMDSGCSRHMTGDKALFYELKPFNEGTVAFGNNEKGKIRSKGNIFEFSNACIEEVLFVEGLKHNLISIRQLCDKG